MTANTTRFFFAARIIFSAPLTVSEIGFSLSTWKPAFIASTAIGA